MNSHEVVMKEMQGKCRFEVFEFLRKSVGKSSESTHLHTHSQVLSLNIAC